MGLLTRSSALGSSPLPKRPSLQELPSWTREHSGISFLTGTAEALGRVLPDKPQVTPAWLQRRREKNKVIVSLVVEPLKVNSLLPWKPFLISPAPSLHLLFF